MLIALYCCQCVLRKMISVCVSRKIEIVGAGGVGRRIQRFSAGAADRADRQALNSVVCIIIGFIFIDKMGAHVSINETYIFRKVKYRRV